VQSGFDSKWYCSDVSNCLFRAGTSPNTWSKTTDGASNEDWTNPLVDDDSTNPFCTPHTDTDYACSKIKCIQQRLFDTGDVADFKLELGSKMKIRPGRARLGINEKDCTTYCVYTQALPSISTTTAATTEMVAGGVEFTVVSGASTLLTGFATMVASAVALTAF